MASNGTLIKNIYLFLIHVQGEIKKLSNKRKTVGLKRKSAV